MALKRAVLWSPVVTVRISAVQWENVCRRFTAEVSDACFTATGTFYGTSRAFIGRLARIVTDNRFTLRYARWVVAVSR